MHHANPNYWHPRCRGSNGSAQLRPREPWWLVPSYATDLVAGLYHTCMVNTCGDVQCWGRMSMERPPRQRERLPR